MMCPTKEPHESVVSDSEIQGSILTFFFFLIIVRIISFAAYLKQ